MRSRALPSFGNLGSTGTKKFNTKGFGSSHITSNATTSRSNNNNKNNRCRRILTLCKRGCQALFAGVFLWALYGMYNALNPPDLGRPLRIAFVGNSMLHLNDCPGLLVKMLEAPENRIRYNVTYDACLVGEQSLASLLWGSVECTFKHSTSLFGRSKKKKFNEEGEEQEDETKITMDDLLLGNPLPEELFQDSKSKKGEGANVVTQTQAPATNYNKWDYVVMVDQDRAPAVLSAYRATIRALNRTSFAAKMYDGGATPVLVQTAAYRNMTGARAAYIGSFDDFHAILTKGYQDYANTLTNYFTKRKQQQAPQPYETSHKTNTLRQRHPSKALISPVGQAFVTVQKDHPKLFEKLYHEDHKHPSPYGTYLQACVLYITLVKREPPPYKLQYWTVYHDNFFGRYRTSDLKGHITKDAVPTLEEGMLLRAAALRTTGLIGP